MKERQSDEAHERECGSLSGTLEATMIPAREALQKLVEGNRRFVADERTSESYASQAHRAALVAGQAPFAVILGCSDSRVPVEIVFDQGLGDLFVIRVAGNIVAPSQVSSVEFAAERFGTRLVVVLGHTRCGAIEATIDALKAPPHLRARDPHSIVDRVRPSVEGLLQTELRHDHDALVHHAVRANIRASANHLRHGSQVIEQLSQSDGLLVVGAEYSLETGMVDFFDGAD
jgi:carbonic anhydrase